MELTPSSQSVSLNTGNMFPVNLFFVCPSHSVGNPSSGGWEGILFMCLWLPCMHACYCLSFDLIIDWLIMGHFYWNFVYKILGFELNWYTFRFIRKLNCFLKSVNIISIFFFEMVAFHLHGFVHITQSTVSLAELTGKLSVNRKMTRTPCGSVCVFWPVLFVAVYDQYFI